MPPFFSEDGKDDGLHVSCGRSMIAGYGVRLRDGRRTRSPEVPRVSERLLAALVDLARTESVPFR